MPDTPLSLLQRLQRAPVDADWQQVVELYTPLIQYWLRRQGIPQSDVDDLTQDSLKALVQALPEFRHAGQPGSFRAWLRVITANRMRGYWRKLRNHAPALNLDQVVDQLLEPSSDLSRQWDREHDGHVAHALLDRVKRDFNAATLRIFHRVVIDNASATVVAAEFQVNVAVVWNAKSRVLKRLRQEANGLLD